ncbi:DUF4034 domain-containing protein [Glycomyces albidus]|uniref:DUF4034 domain-containing protein n=1 Tax=Glycomyces albidus TaxID=2656774 RepID=A0A6L5GEU9_9ACTN|nr:DUF4034 domain-containing protein [Glycomyces albidus]MQM28116.1 DUF4034 domain-containing protein [Glycomyces albidus]
MEDVSQQELIALIRQVDPTVNPAEIIPGLPDIPAVDVTRWGMPPMEALSTDLSRTVPAVAAAVDAVRAGDWRPAAALLDRSYGDWAMRAVAVHALGEAAADDVRWLEAWKAAVGGRDRNLAVVEAHGLCWLSWKLRGNRPDATARQQEAFHTLQMRCEEVAQRAASLAPEDPTPWLTLIIIARGRGYSAETFTSIFRELQTRDPLHRAGHEFALMYWSESAVSFEPVLAFAERAAAASPTLAFLLLQAAYDAEDDFEGVWQDPRVRHALDTILRGLASPAAAVGVYAASDRNWAAYALVNSGRGAEAVPLFVQLGTNASARPWEDFGPDAVVVFDAFRRRACAAVRT